MLVISSPRWVGLEARVITHSEDGLIWSRIVLAIEMAIHMYRVPRASTRIPTATRIREGRFAGKRRDRKPPINSRMIPNIIKYIANRVSIRVAKILRRTGSAWGGDVDGMVVESMKKCTFPVQSVRWLIQATFDSEGPNCHKVTLCLPSCNDSLTHRQTIGTVKVRHLLIYKYSVRCTMWLVNSPEARSLAPSPLSLSLRVPFAAIPLTHCRWCEQQAMQSTFIPLPVCSRCSKIDMTLSDRNPLRHWNTLILS